MIRNNDIKDALAHLVGWEQGYGDTAIDSALCESESGITYQMAHPLLTLSNVRGIMPEDYIMKYPAWVNDKIYDAGEIVREGNEAYKCTRTHSNYKPSTHPDYWSEYNPLNDFLTMQVDKGIVQAMQRFTQEKTLRNETKALLERRVFFDGAGRMSATIQKNGRVVGYEITPLRSFGVTTEIVSIGLQFTGVSEGFMLPVFLFHSSKSEPVAVKECVYTSTTSTFQWFDLTEWFMPYISANTNAGGAWYLCYFEGDLPVEVEAVNMTKDWSKEPCTTCGISDLRAWRELTKYIQISPFAAPVPSDWNNNVALWDIGQNLYTSTMNYGMNCRVTVECDITDFIIEQRKVFANVVQKQVAYNILRTMSMNPDVRVNRNQSNVSRIDVLYELDGDTRGRRGGLGYELDKAYDALRIDTQRMDRACLTCNNYGVAYTTV